MTGSTIKTIGFIGLGIMGQSMAGHILAGGFGLNVYNRTKSKADGLVSRGAKWFDTPGEVAAHSDLVITIVGFPRDVEEVYFGPQGIIAHAKKQHRQGQMRRDALGQFGQTILGLGRGGVKRQQCGLCSLAAQQVFAQKPRI